MKGKEKFNTILKSLINGFIKGTAVVVIVALILFCTESYFKSDMYLDSKKEYVLENIDQFELAKIHEGDNFYIYKMYLDDGGYYDEVSIVLNHSFNQIVFWADRDRTNTWDEFLWFVIRDTSIDLSEEDELNSAIIAEIKKKRIHDGN